MPTNEQRNEREKKYDRPNKVNKRASDRTRVANVTNEHANARTQARTHIWTNDVGNISRKTLITIAFYTRVSVYAHLDLLSLSFFYACAALFMFTFLKTRPDIIIRQYASCDSWATWSKMTELIIALRACLLSVTCSSDGLLV